MTSSSKVEVRRATPADLPEIRELGRVTLAASYAPLSGQAYADHVFATWCSPEALATSMRRSANLVAMSGDEIVGLATIGMQDGVATLWKLFVLPAYQGSGVGTLLINEAEKHAGGALSLRLSYFDGHEPAARFYRSRGFIEVSREVDPAGWPDGIWIERPIGAAARR